MARTNCKHCDRTDYLYLSKCKKCDLLFCDNCSEAAAELSGKMQHSSATLTMHQPVCPACGATEIDIGIEV